MLTLLLIARLALAAVFTLAALAKLADRRGAREGARGLGAPAALAAPLAVVLPAAELAIAGGLLVPATAVPAAIAAAALLLVFSGAVAVALRRGRAVACRCFGELSASKPVGPGTLARNAGLLALAAFVAVAGTGDPGASAVAWLGGLSAGEAAALAVAVAAVVVAGACAALALRLLRGHGVALARIDALEATMRGAGLDDLLDRALETVLPAVGLPAGTPAPAFALEPASGGATVTLDDLLAAERPVLAVFADAECGPCRALMPDLARWQRDHADRLTVALVGGGDRADLAALAAEHGVRGALLDPRSATYAAYAMSGTPGAVLIAPDATIAAAGAAGADQIAALVARATAGPLEVGRWEPAAGVPEGLPTGSPVPEVTLDGAPAPLAEALGDGPAVLLFWNPGCGFCDAMRDDVAAWPDGAPALHVVSRAPDPELAARVLLDPEGAAADAFGAGGTPMAVLVENGRVAAPLAAGRDEVLALAGRRAVMA